MGNFERKTRKHDSTCQTRPRTLQARFGEGKKFPQGKKKDKEWSQHPVSTTGKELWTSSLEREREKGERGAVEIGRREERKGVGCCV